LIALPRPVFLLCLLASLALLPACSTRVEFPDYEVIELEPGPDLEFRAREVFATVKPGTLIQFPPGNWEFGDELVLTASHITLRGAGPGLTTLDFTNQQTGGQGILATGDAFAIQDLRVLNPKGDGVRVEGADGVVFQNLHVEWSGEPDTDNGAYGIYPVLSRNVLIDGCYVRGSSDAGIYVGQSETVVVRRSRAEGNVAGIEIENTKDADVYFNVATDNTGGLLVFDGPGLIEDGCRVYVGSEDPPGCKGTRVWANWVYGNNRENFASGGTVALVPQGTGFLLLSTDKIEVFGNVFRGNDSSNLVIVTTQLLEEWGGYRYDDQDFDPWVEHVDIHHNVVADGGGNPDVDGSELDSIVNIFFAGQGIPQVLFDGYVDPAKVGSDGNLPPEINICVRDNTDGAGGEPFYASLNRLVYPPDLDASKRDCSLPAREPTLLEEFTTAPVVEDPYTPEEIAALCDPGASPALGVNWAAAVVNCPNLADYRLFQDPGDPTRDPNGGVPFDLTTPLFSDYALKDRFVFVPPGQQVQYSDDAVFSFPVGTIIAKSFKIAHDLRDPGAGDELIETRLLIRRADGWAGMAYVWNEARTEATLAIGGGAADVEWIHSDGSVRATTYQIPNTGQCARCHTSSTDGAVPIGPTARMLNKPFDYGNGVVENQLVRWTELGVLAGAPADPAGAPRLPVWNDPSDGTLEQRAKAYLESNCAHCHRPGGAARQSGLYLEAARPLSSAYGLCKGPVSAGPGAGGLDYDLVPGDPLASILVFRMTRNEAQIKMPELSRSVVHEEGVQLVSEWIASLPGSCE
jgi:parallel beta-helix repeat protein